MSLTRPRFRLLMLAAAAALVIAGLTIRGSGTGLWEQHSGTALYASMAYVGVLFLRPHLSPWIAGGAAWAWCWAVELLQLTGVPAELSSRSPLARLVLGAHFDPADLFWYLPGIVPLVAVHHLVNRSARARRER